MPKQLERDAYCLAPPLSTTTLCPPQISRETEARHPRAPLVFVNREIESSDIESVEFVVNNEEDVKPPVKIEVNPRQLRVGIATLSIRPPPSSASTSSGEATAAVPGPSRESPDRGPVPHPEQQLGPSGPAPWPRPAKGSKSQLWNFDTARARREAKGRGEPRRDVVIHAGLGGPYANPPRSTACAKVSDSLSPPRPFSGPPNSL